MASSGAEEVGVRIAGHLREKEIPFDKQLRRLPWQDAGEDALATARRALREEVDPSLDCIPLQQSADLAAAQLLSSEWQSDFQQRCINAALRQSGAANLREREAIQHELSHGSARALAAITAAAGCDVLLLSDESKVPQYRLERILSLAPSVIFWNRPFLPSPFAPPKESTWRWTLIEQQNAGMNQDNSQSGILCLAYLNRRWTGFICCQNSDGVSSPLEPTVKYMKSPDDKCRILPDAAASIPDGHIYIENGRSWKIRKHVGQHISDEEIHVYRKELNGSFQCMYKILPWYNKTQDEDKCRRELADNLHTSVTMFNGEVDEELKELAHGYTEKEYNPELVLIGQEGTGKTFTLNAITRSVARPSTNATQRQESDWYETIGSREEIDEDLYLQDGHNGESVVADDDLNIWDIDGFPLPTARYSSGGASKQLIKVRASILADGVYICIKYREQSDVAKILNLATRNLDADGISVAEEESASDEEERENDECEILQNQAADTADEQTDGRHLENAYCVDTETSDSETAYIEACMCLGIPLDNYSENLCHYYKEHGDLKLPAFFRGRLGKEYRKCLGRDSIEHALKRARELLIRHAGHSRSCPGLVEHVSLIVPAREDIVMHDIPGAPPFYSNPALNALLKDALKKVNLVCYAHKARDVDITRVLRYMDDLGLIDKVNQGEASMLQLCSVDVNELSSTSLKSLHTQSFYLPKRVCSLSESILGKSLEDRKRPNFAASNDREKPWKQFILLAAKGDAHEHTNVRQLWSLESFVQELLKICREEHTQSSANVAIKRSVANHALRVLEQTLNSGNALPSPNKETHQKLEKITRSIGRSVRALTPESEAELGTSSQRQDLPLDYDLMEVAEEVRNETDVHEKGRGCPKRCDMQRVQERWNEAADQGENHTIYEFYTERRRQRLSNAMKNPTNLFISFMFGNDFVRRTACKLEEKVRDRFYAKIDEVFAEMTAQLSRMLNENSRIMAESRMDRMRATLKNNFDHAASDLRILSESEALVHGVRRAISKQGPKSLRKRRGERRLTINVAMLHNLGELSDVIAKNAQNHCIQHVWLPRCKKMCELLDSNAKHIAEIAVRETQADQGIDVDPQLSKESQETVRRLADILCRIQKRLYEPTPELDTSVEYYVHDALIFAKCISYKRVAGITTSEYAEAKKQLEAEGDSKPLPGRLTPEKTSKKKRKRSDGHEGNVKSQTKKKKAGS
jgi:hypothetical protein